MLAPVALLAGRHIRAVIAAGVLVVFMLLLIAGVAVWAPFFVAGRHAAQAILQAPFGIGYQQFGVSVFWMLRSFGLGLSVAYTVQIVSALIAAGLTWRLWRTEGDATRRVALTVCLSLLVTPYGFTYDMTAYSAVLAMLAAQRGWRIRVAMRRPDEALFLKPIGAVGQIVPVQANLRAEPSVAAAVVGADAVVNLVGLLYERKHSLAIADYGGVATAAIERPLCRGREAAGLAVAGGLQTSGAR